MTDQEFDAVLGTLDYLETMLKDLQNRVDDLESDNRYLQSDIEDLNDRIYTFEHAGDQ